MLKLLLAAILVYTTNQIHFPADLGLPGLNIVNLMVLAGFGLLLMSPRDPEAHRPTLDGPLKFYFLALAVGLVIALVSRPMGLMADLTYFKTLVFFPLYYYLFFHGVQDRRTAWQLLLVVGAVAALAALEALSEARAYGFTYSETRRSAGPFGPDYRSSNRAAVFYAMFLPLFLAPLLMLRGQAFWRLVALGCVLLVAAAILFTYSRQGYAIGLLAAALVALRRGPFTALVLAAVFAVALPMLPEGASERVSETQQEGEFGEEQLDESTESRFEIWSGAMAMWSENPMGTGLNRFKSLIGEYSIYSDIDAHNYFVLTLAEAGPLGVVALLWLVWSMWRLARLVQGAAIDARTVALARGLQIAVLAMVLGNLYGSPFSEGAVMGMFWAVLALLERLAILEQREAEAWAAMAEASAGAADARASEPRLRHPDGGLTAGRP